MGALFAFVQKEVRHLLRDRQTLAILLLLPVAQLMLFGFAVRTDIHAVRVAVVANDHDFASAALQSRFANSGRFVLLPPLSTPNELDALFRRGAVDVGVLLPSNVPDRLIASGRGAATHVEPLSVLLITDAADPNSGTTMLNYALVIVRAWGAERGERSQRVRVETRMRMRFNPTLESVNLFVPGLIALILTMVTTLMTSVSLAGEKERGTYELLLVSPLHPWQIIVGKVLPYLGLALINVLSILVAGRYVFGVPLNGSMTLLIAASMLFALTGLALGILIAAVTSSQLAAMLTALGGTMLPNTLLSGLIFPISSMPTPLQLISHAVPARWFIEVVRGIMLKGVGLDVLRTPFLVLVGMLIFLLIVAIRRTDVRMSS